MHVDAKERRLDEFKALRKGLGYCWSVAVAAPGRREPPFEQLGAGGEETTASQVGRISGSGA